MHALATCITLNVSQTGCTVPSQLGLNRVRWFGEPVLYPLSQTCWRGRGKQARIGKIKVKMREKNVSTYMFAHNSGSKIKLSIAMKSLFKFLIFAEDATFDSISCLCTSSLSSSSVTVNDAIKNHISHRLTNGK